MDQSDLQALVKFGQLGIRMGQARILSIVALLGFVGIGVYAAYLGSWQAVAVSGIAALVAMSAVRSEAAANVKAQADG